MGKKQIKNLLPLLLVLLAIPFTVYQARSNPQLGRFFNRSQALGEGCTTQSLDSLSTPNPTTSSIQGFSTDLSVGAASISYPLELPAGPGGIKPGLSIAYSSAAVDDQHAGVFDPNNIGDVDFWKRAYNSQASWLGLGWNLGGLGFIARKPGNKTDATEEESQDDEYFLAFPGGSTRIFLAGNDWQTDPKIPLKIEHEVYPKSHKYAYDTAPWTITTADGTKYYFGQPIFKESTDNDLNGRFIKQEGSREVIPISFNFDGNDQEKYNKNFLGEQSLATQYTILSRKIANFEESTTQITASRWLLRKIENTNSNIVDIDYETRFKIMCSYSNLAFGSKIGTDACANGKCPNAIVHDITPKLISWGKNSQAGTTHRFFVAFSRDKLAGNAWKVTDFDNNCSQTPFSSDKLASIGIRVGTRENSTILRKYQLGYEYSQTVPNSEIQHLLLNKIEILGKEGNGSLPAYTFTYYKDGNNIFNNTLLKSADNGYGGKVTYFYDGPYKTNTCNTAGLCVINAWTARNRLVKTVNSVTITGAPEKTFENQYRYNSEYTDNGVKIGLGFVNCQIPDINLCLSSFEFLGYADTETITTQYGSTQVAGRSKTYFTIPGANAGNGNGQIIHQPNTCFNVDPRRGIAFKTQILSPDGSRVLGETASTYRVKPDLSADNTGGLNCRRIPLAEKSPARVELASQSQSKIDTVTITTKTEFPNYDEYGNLLLQIEHGNTAKTNDEKTTQFEYNYNLTKWILNRPSFIKIFPGTTAASEPKIVTENHYDSAGNLTMTKTGQGGLWVDTKTEYDGLGNPVKQIDANGNVMETIFASDDPHHLYPWKIKNPKGWELIMEYDNGKVLGLPTRIIDVNNLYTDIKYDNYGRRLAMAKQPDNLDSPTFKFSYQDGVPNITKTETKFEGSRYITGWQITNGFGQTIQSRNRAEINGAVKDILSTTEYDSLGRAVLGSKPYETATNDNPSFAPIADWNSLPRVTYEYDALGRTTAAEEKAPDGTSRKSTLVYNGWITDTIDANNHLTRTESDAYGNTIRIKDAKNNQSLFEYDIVLGKLTKAVYPLSATANIHYDALGRKTRMVDPDLGTWNYKYDNNGNLRFQTDANNQRIELQYDNLNRPIKKIYPDDQAIIFEYDQGTLAKEKLSKMTDLTGRTEYQYYLNNNLFISKITKSIGSINKVMETAVNAGGTLIYTKYPDGETLRPTYNNTGQIKTITGTNNYLTDAVYNHFGAIKTAAYGNNTRTEQEFDLTGRLTNIQTKKDNNLLSRWHYFTDPVGNITDITDKDTLAEASDKKIHYIYDEISRLVSARGQYQTDYQYDTAGNMLKKTEDTEVNLLYNDPTHAHAPKVVNDFTYRYDNNGNLLEDEARQIEWNFDNKPIKITMKSTGVVTEFKYDGNGQRVAKKVTDTGTTPTLTPTPPLTPSPPPGIVSLRGKVDLWRRQPAPNSSWETNIKVTIGQTEHSLPTDNSGSFFISGLSVGIYDIRVKSTHSLSNIRKGVVLTGGINQINFGTLLEGDANNDDKVYMDDFYVLKDTFNSSSDRRSDFNQDGIVNIYDFYPIKWNFNKNGPIDITNQSATILGAASESSAKLSFTPLYNRIKYSDVIQLKIEVDTGEITTFATQVHFILNPQFFELVNQDGSNAEKIPEENLNHQDFSGNLYNQYNHENGDITFVLFKLGDNPPKGKITLATLYIKPKKPVGQTCLGVNLISLTTGTDNFIGSDDGKNILGQISGSQFAVVPDNNAEACYHCDAAPYGTPSCDFIGASGSDRIRFLITNWQIIPSTIAVPPYDILKTDMNSDGLVDEKDLSIILKTLQFNPSNF